MDSERLSDASLRELWTSDIVRSIKSTPNTITLQVPCSHGLLTVHHELDSKNNIHTHLALHSAQGAYMHGYYRHPDGEVIGPIYRD